MKTYKKVLQLIMTKEQRRKPIPGVRGHSSTAGKEFDEKLNASNKILRIMKCTHALHHGGAREASCQLLTRDHGEAYGIESAHHGYGV
jgi:hypothetical protein